MTVDEVMKAFVQCKVCGCWARAVNHQCPGPVPPGEFETPEGFEFCMEGRPECEEFSRLIAEAKRSQERWRKHLRLIIGGLGMIIALVGAGGFH